MSYTVCEPIAYSAREGYIDFIRRHRLQDKQICNPPIKHITINQIYAIEPRVKQVIDKAKEEENPNWETYSHYKAVLSSLVGFNAEKGELRSSKAYELAIKKLCDVLQL